MAAIIVVGNGCPLPLYLTTNTLIMCTKCVTPRHCSCFNDSLRKAKKQQRDRAVKALTTALQKRKVPCLPTRTDNIVSIPLADNSRVLLSLKSRRDDSNYVIYKYRPAESSKWQEMRRDDFFAWLMPLIPQILISAQSQSFEAMPFGMYMGIPISYVAANDKNYCRWVIEKVDGCSSLKKKIASFL